VIKIKISLILLTWNEIEGVKHIVPLISREWVDEIICVDGGSIDGTVEWLKNHNIPVYFQQKHGRAEAFRVGLSKANGDVLLYFSPDGNEDPADIPHIINKMKEGHDLVIASRFSKMSKSDDATFVRRFGNNFFTKLVNLFWNANVTDAINGFRAVKKSCLQDIAIEAKRFEVEIEMTIRAAKRGYRITEIPTHERRRISGKSKLNTFRDGWIYLKTILRELRS
jgi:glycosyltransferase involved in cell wall biosynthesis